MKHKIQFLIFLPCILCACAHQPKTGFISLSMIYDKFPMKQEMESKYLNIESTRKALIDSMTIILNNKAAVLNDKSSPEKIREFQQERADLAQKQAFFKDDNQKALQQYSGEVWKQINQYVKDYGEQNGYDYIYGAGGEGSIMYADKKNDITQQVSDYVNQRYKGSKK